MPELAVIDLGDVSGEPEVAPRPAGIRRRPLLAGGVLVAAPTVLAGAAAPPRLTGFRIPDVNEGFLTADDQRVFTMRMAEDRSTLTAVITAYRLVDGSRLWQSDVPAALGEPGRFGVAEGILFMMVGPDGDTDQIAALDTATGRRLWTRVGHLGGWGARDTGPGPMLLRDPAEGTKGPRTLRGIDPRTGAQVWSYTSPDGAQTDTWGGGASRGTRTMVTGLPSGRAEVRDTGTGRLLASGTVRGPAPRPYDMANSWIQMVGDLVLVWSVDWRTLTAYGLHRLDRRWSVPWDGGIGDWFAIPSGSAGVVGLQSGAGQFRGLDPDTGRLLWEQRWSTLQPIGGLLWGFHDGLAADMDWPVSLVDPVTGRIRAELGRWSAVAQWSDEDDVLLTRTNHESGRMLVALLEPGATDVRLLGVLPGGTRTCMASGKLLICNQPGSSMGIWRYR